MVGVCAALGVVTGGALVRLMAVICEEVVVGIFSGFRTINGVLSGLWGRVGGARGGGGATHPVVLDGGLTGGLTRGGEDEGGDIVLVEGGGRVRTGVVPPAGCSREGLETRDGATSWI